MTSPTSSPRKIGQYSVSSGESTEELSSSEDVNFDTDSSEKSMRQPRMKIRRPTHTESVYAENDLFTKFFRALSTGSCLSRLSKEKIHDLAKFLKNMPELNLTILNIDRSAIDDDGAKLLATIIKQQTKITAVSFTSCEIGDEGAKALAEAIKTNSGCSITTLELFNNDIGIEGVRAIAEMLTNNTSITELNLGGNEIENEGINILVDGIKSNNTITSIFLNSICIDSDGVKALANLIQTSTTLLTIELGYNQITADGAIYLADAIKANPHTKLAKLNLRGNAIGELNYKKCDYTNDGYAALADAMEVNSSIVKINVCNINGDDEYNKLDKEIIKQQSELNDIKPILIEKIAVGLDLLTRHPNPNDGIVTSVRDVNTLIAQKLFLLDKSDKLISAKIRKNPDIVINKYT